MYRAQLSAPPYTGVEHCFHNQQIQAAKFYKPVEKSIMELLTFRQNIATFWIKPCSPVR